MRNPRAENWWVMKRGMATAPFDGGGGRIDLGIKDLAITSDGVKYDNLHSYRRNLKKLVRLQRQLSRKSKGSRNRRRLALRLRSCTSILPTSGMMPSIR